jgi:hypothetical protein
MAAVGKRRGRSVFRRTVAAIAVGLGLLVVIALFAPPLVLRGPVLSALARHQSKSLCGTVELSGGHLSANAVVALILQRPFDVALDGVRIREPEGGDLFRAGAVRLRMAVLRKPWRLAVERGRVADGAWQLASQGVGQLLTAALEKIPAAGRAACRVAAPEENAAPTPIGPLIRVESLALHNISLSLSFPFWAVKLDGLDAQGSLELRGTAEGAQIFFDARDVQTHGLGSLRIGPAGTPHTFEVPFDSVNIPHVGVTEASPYDLQLTLTAARTRGAKLSGEATFTDVFAPKSSGRSAGMVLSARWTELGQALARDPPWASVGRRLAALHAGVRTSLRGPFDALTGSADVDGKGLSLRARLLPHHRYALDADFRALDTRPLLARAQRQSLGGTLDGHLAVSARLGPAPEDRSITLDALALALERESASDGMPRSWVVERVRPGSSPPSSSAADVRVTLGQVALERDEIIVDPFRVQAPGMAIAGSLRGGAAKTTWLRARFTPESRATWRDETFRLPPQLNIDRNAHGDLTIAPFDIANVAGGTVGIAGSIRHDGPVDLHATVLRYPLAHLPGVARAHVPGQRAPLGQLLGGELDADLSLRGTRRSPSLSGQLALANLRWARQPMGDGAIRFEAIDGGTRFGGRLLSGADVNGSFTRQAGASLHARLALAQLQRALPALRLRRASGVVAADLDWRGESAKPSARVDARVSWAQPLSIWPARLPAPIEVRPAQIALHDDELSMTNVVARSAGLQATLAGHMKIDPDDKGASRLSATADVTADGRQLAAALGSRNRLAGGGSAALSATLSGSLRALQLHGQARFQALAIDWPGSPVGAIRLDGPLAIDGPIGGAGAGPELVVGPLAARLASGGWIMVAGSHGPGRIQLAPHRSPLPIAGIDLLVRGTGLTTRHPIGGVSLKNLAFALALTPRDSRVQTLWLTGSVHLEQTVYQLGAGQGKKPSKPAAKPTTAPRPTVLDRIVAHNLQIIGPRGAVKASVPYAPDVTVGLHCTINGPIAKPEIAGQVRGSGLYSRVALTVADWFTSRNLRQCDFGPR